LPEDIDFVKEHSSNFRELRNLVESVEAAVTKGMLDNCELFMFTDNSTAEAAYYKGTSSSEALFDLVLRLRKLEMTGRCCIHLVHIAGTRMIWQGTDGLSRGDQNAGVMAGDTMLSFVPLHQAALDRSDRLLPWIETWCTSTDDVRFPTKIMKVNDWPTSLKERATYIWSPPPAIADVAAEFLAGAIHKRPTSTHIFVCPRLMCSRWFKFVLKATDMTLSIPIGCSIWGFENHEPLILAIAFPLSRTQPWRQGKSAHVEHTTMVVQGMLSSDPERSGTLLRELVARAWAMGSV
jgi:hypothetical protein